jgi:hypothetical protein
VGIVAFVTVETEGVARGAAWALIAVPAGMLVFGLLGGSAGILSGIPAFGIPLLAAWLFSRGAGFPLRENGWRQFIPVTAAAVVVGLVTGVITAAAHSFVHVGGKGFGAFATTVRTEFLSLGTLLQLALGLALGGIALILMLRRSRMVAREPV